MHARQKELLPRLTRICAASPALRVLLLLRMLLLTPVQLAFGQPHTLHQCTRTKRSWTLESCCYGGKVRGWVSAGERLDVMGGWARKREGMLEEEEGKRVG